MSSVSYTLTTSEISSDQAFIPMAWWDTLFSYQLTRNYADSDNASVATLWANGSRVMFFNHSGRLLWTVDGLSNINFPIGGDFDRDGVVDDLFEGTAYTSAGSLITLPINNPPTYENFTSCNNMRAAGDLNHDGYADDVVVQFLNGSHPYISAYPYLGDVGTAYWNFSMYVPVGVLLDCMQIGDLDGDGFRDDVAIMTTINMTYALNETGGLLWSFPAGGGSLVRPINTRMVIGDFDRDGHPNEVAVASRYQESVFVIDRTGNELWSYPLNETYSFLAVSDIDHDGYEDDLAFLTASEGYLRHLHVVDGTGTELWNYTFSPNYYGYLVTSDFDGNGYRDNIQLGAFNTLGYVFNQSGEVIARGGYDAMTWLHDYDGDGAQDDMITTGPGDDLWQFRFDQPHITVNFSRSTPQELEAGDRTIYYNFTSAELSPLYIECVLSDSVHTSSPIWEIQPGTSNQSHTFSFMAGTHNLSLTLEYKNIPFYEIQLAITVHPVSTIAFSAWMMIGLGFIIVLMYNRRHSFIIS